MHDYVQAATIDGQTSRPISINYSTTAIFHLQLVLDSRMSITSPALME